MNMNDYQARAVSTRIYPEFFNVIYPMIKLNGEAGEVAEKVGKLIRDKGFPLQPMTMEDKIAIAKELGDCLWYIAAMAADLQYSLHDIAEMNLSKLAERKAKGVISGSGDEREVLVQHPGRS